LLIIKTPKRHFLSKTASYEPSCVEISSVIFTVGDDKNKQESPAGIKAGATAVRV